MKQYYWFVSSFIHSSSSLSLSLRPSSLRLLFSPSTFSSLDLGGPLYLGGLRQSDLKINFPVSSQQFHGCLRDVTVNGKLLDLASSANRSSGIHFGSCPALGRFCNSSVLCQNGGQCIDVWDTYYCQCRHGYGGRHCENGVYPIPMVAFIPSAFGSCLWQISTLAVDVSWSGRSPVAR